MKKERIYVVIGLGIVLVAGLGGLAWRLLRQPPELAYGGQPISYGLAQPQPGRPAKGVATDSNAIPFLIKQHAGPMAVLPDASRIYLVRVSFGEKKEFTTETLLREALRRILPQRYRSWLPPAVIMDNVYLSDAGPSGLRCILAGTTNAQGQLPDRWFVTEDDAGFHYDTMVVLRVDRAFAYNYWDVEPTAYPRRQKKFLLKVLSGPTNAVVASFEIPNPEYRKFPDWRPSPMPQTQTNGRVTFTLFGLSRRKGDPQGIITRWKAETHDPAWSNAQVRAVILYDASGNQSLPRVNWSPALSANGWSATNGFLASLSPREPAWKVRVLVERARSEDYAPFEKAILTNQAFPRVLVSGTQRGVEQAQTVGGNLKIKLLDTGPCLPSSNGVVRLISFEVESELSNGNYFDRLEGRLVDNLGRQTNRVVELKHNRHPEDPSTNRLSFAPLPGTTSATLEIHLNRPLIFDFLIDPKAVQEDEP
jgi:hypothetical protein